jgi:hypothetical protein
MAAEKLNFKHWYHQADEPVPLHFVPELLNISRTQVARAVKDGKLRVLTFRADNGKVYRMVPRLDLKLYGKNPLTQQGLSHAMRRLLAA